MHLKTALLAAACGLALAACGDRSADTTADATPDATQAPADATAPAPAPEPVAPAPEPATPATGDKPAATVADCATTIEGNDAMQFNVGSIAVPASCTEFTITLNHTGTLAELAMGHNVVVTSEADMAGVAADGITAGVDAGYVKAGDARVVAKTDVIGGGETTSVTFPVSKLQSGGPYVFFCSFPGHSSIMKGTIAVQ